MPHVVIVHGWTSRPESNWKPWLKRELEERGVKVDVPAMPNSQHPKCSEWVKMIADTVGEPTEDTFLVGHSLGSLAILRYLETLQGDQKVGGVILLAGFGKKWDSYGGQHPDFFDEEIRWDYVRERADHFAAIHSDDDKNVPIEMLDLFHDKLGSRKIRVHGMGHFSSDDGVFEVPVVRDELLRMMKNA